MVIVECRLEPVSQVSHRCSDEMRAETSGENMLTEECRLEHEQVTSLFFDLVVDVNVIFMSVSCICVHAL